MKRLSTVFLTFLLAAGLAAAADQKTLTVWYPETDEASKELAAQWQAAHPDVKLNVYSGEFTVTLRVAAVRTAVPGNFTVHGTLHYQACDDKLCYPPKDMDFAFNVKVVKGARRR